MKTYMRVLLIGVVVTVMLMATVLSVSAAPYEQPVLVKTTKSGTLFVFKADRMFLGAKVEVFAANGEMVTANELSRRKMIIDFRNVREGSYRIVITKGKYTREFEYEK